MADMNIPSMFDTQYAMDRQMQNDAMNAGQLPLGGGMMYASSLSGDIYNKGLMGLAGMMGGAPSPEMAKQQALEEVFQQFGNPQTPEDAIAIADALQAKGLYGEAMQFMNFANEMRASMPQRTKTQAADGYYYYDDTGERVFPNVTKAPEKPSALMERLELWRKSTPEQRVEYTEAGIFGKDSTEINVFNETANAYSEAMGKNFAEMDTNLIKGAKKAMSTINKTNQALQLIEDDGVTTGFASEIITNFKRVGSKLGSDTMAEDVSKDQYLDALLGSDVFPLISQLEIGARGLDTPAERDFLLKVMTGERKLDKGALQRITILRQNIAREIIQKYNNAIDDGSLSQAQEFRALKKYDIPDMVQMTILRPNYAKEILNPQGQPTGFWYWDGKYYNSNNEEASRDIIFGGQ